MDCKLFSAVLTVMSVALLAVSCVNHRQSASIIIELDSLRTCGFNQIEVLETDDQLIQSKAFGTGVQCLRDIIPNNHADKWSRAMSVIDSVQNAGGGSKGSVDRDGIHIRMTKTGGYVVTVD